MLLCNPCKIGVSQLYILWVIFILKYVISGLIKMQRKQREYQQKMSDVTLYSCLQKFAAVQGQCWCHFFASPEITFLPSMIHGRIILVLYFHFPCYSFICILKCLDLWKNTLLRLKVALNSRCCWDVKPCTLCAEIHLCVPTTGKKAFAVDNPRDAISWSRVQNSSHLKGKENTLLYYGNKHFKVHILLAQALFWAHGKGRSHAMRDWGNIKWVDGLRGCLKGLIKTRRVWHFRKGNTTRHRLFILDIIWIVHKMGVGLVVKTELAWKASNSFPWGPQNKSYFKIPFCKWAHDNPGIVMLDICLGFVVYLFLRVSFRGQDMDLMGSRF